MSVAFDLDAQVELLTRINTTEFIQALGLGHLKRGRAVLERLARPAARHIARDMVQYDSLFAARGLRRGAKEVLTSLVKDVEVTGASGVPLTGPLLIVANHPGISDVLAIFAAIERDDLRVVAAEYPLLRALTGVNQTFIWVPQQRRAAQRRDVLHEIRSHLRSGGSVLLLPAGNIEPDPAVHRHAAAGLDLWSPSVGLIAHRIPDLVVVAAIVSGVLLRAYQVHPATRIRKRAADRQQLGAMLQVLARASRSATVHLSFSPPLSVEALSARGPSARAATAVVVDQARRLMQAAGSPSRGDS